MKEAVAISIMQMVFFINLWFVFKYQKAQDVLKDGIIIGSMDELWITKWIYSIKCI